MDPTWSRANPLSALISCVLFVSASVIICTGTTKGEGVSSSLIERDMDNGTHHRLAANSKQDLRRWPLGQMQR